MARRTNIYLKEENHERLRLMAEEVNRSLSNLINVMIEERWIEFVNNGNPPTPPAESELMSKEIR